MKKQFLVSLALAVILAPQISFAAWWNPFTWFKKPAAPVVPKAVQVVSTTPAALTKEKSNAKVATTTSKVTKETMVSKPKITLQTITADQSTEIEKLRKEVGKEKQKVTQLTSKRLPTGTSTTSTSLSPKQPTLTPQDSQEQSRKEEEKRVATEQKQLREAQRLARQKVAEERQSEIKKQQQLENQRLAEQKSIDEKSTKVQGVISQNTVWTLENSPYLVVDNILIESGISLKIEQGVIVRFTQNKFVQVMGDLQATGTKENPVLFTANIANSDSGFWGPIKIGLAGEYERGGNITLEYCKIEYGKGINIEAQVFHESDFNNFAIKNCVFEKNSLGIYAHRPGPNSYVKNSIFTDNVVGIYIGWDIKYIQNPKNIDVVYNIFKNNNIGLQVASYGGIPPDPEHHSTLQVKWNIFLQNRKYNLEMKYKDDLVVTDNWWGTTDTSIIDSKIYDYSDDFEKGRAIYTPFATSEFAKAGVQ